jgi:tetratricopeptide (TPR) repeat protein
MEKFTRLALLFFALAVAACSPAAKKEASEIDGLEQALLGDSLGGFDRERALGLVRKYDAFAAAHPADTLSAWYLFKAGNLSKDLGDYAAAIRYYGRCSEIETFARREVALFLQGFTYENNLQDLENARRIYTEFLARYPDHGLARDARFSLDNLGKSPEELIRMFEARDSLARLADTTGGT